MVRRWSIRIALGAAVVLAACASYAALSYSPRAEHYDSPSAAAIELSAGLRSWPEHDALYPPRTDPYVLKIEHARGALLYYGAKHSRDPNHPQRSDIEKRWQAFKPTVALCEGRSCGFMIGVLFEPFTGLSEPMPGAPSFGYPRRVGDIDDVGGTVWVRADLSPTHAPQGWGTRGTCNGDCDDRTTSPFPSDFEDRGGSSTASAVQSNHFDANSNRAHHEPRSPAPRRL